MNLTINLARMISRWRMKSVSMAGVALCMALVIYGLGSVRPALAGDLQWRGVVTAMPNNGLIGSWIIGGRGFSTIASTRFDREAGSFAIGVCVDVRYRESANGAIANRLSTKERAECNEATSTATATAKPSKTPSATTTVTPTATPKTPEPDESPEKTATPEASKTPASTATATPVTNGTLQLPPLCDTVRSSKQCKSYGRITSLPTTGLVGTWVISGLNYIVTNQTELETDYGLFAADVCVKVRYNIQNNQRIADQIESEKSYLCRAHNGSNERQEGNLFGVLESFPPNLIGEWKIGGMSFVADNTTNFDQKHVAFTATTTVSVTVKVKFYTDVDGINRAQKIQTTFQKKESSDDDENEEDEDENENEGEDHAHDGAEGMALGVVEAMPANRLGVWRIAGIDYTVTTTTKFEEEKGPITVTASVRVRYHVGADKKRVADAIKTVATAGQGDTSENAHLSGFVSEMPATSFNGHWVVSNVPFESDANSQFDESNGLLALGGYVEVEYQVVNGVNIIIELKTQVPPGAGDSNHTGQIEQMEGGVVAANANAVRTWRIGGVNYVITDATLLNPDLKVGSTVTVNSYTAEDGRQVATEVQSAQFTQRVLLPTVMR